MIYRLCASILSSIIKSPIVIIIKSVNYYNLEWGFSIMLT
jgi:hypothetical protein